MTIPKALSIEVICPSETLYHWLRLTLALGKLKIKQIQYRFPVDTCTFNTQQGSPNLIIATEAEFRHLIKQSKKQISTVFPCPVLVLTETFQTVKKTKEVSLTFDTLPIQIITINLLEHSITSLLKDFSMAAKLTKLAHFDPLTGAANRLLFEDRLSESIKRVKRFKEPISLIYFDLDEFKPINDTYGHDAGDELLKTFVSLVKTNVRELDTLARMGGDEFTLILPNTNRANLVVIANKIMTALNTSAELNFHKIEIKSSLGAVTADSCTSEVLTTEMLLKRADEAVYKAKQTAGTSIVYDSSLTLCSI